MPRQQQLHQLFDLRSATILGTAAHACAQAGGATRQRQWQRQASAAWAHGLLTGAQRWHQNDTLARSALHARHAETAAARASTAARSCAGGAQQPNQVILSWASWASASAVPIVVIIAVAIASSTAAAEHANAARAFAACIR